MIFAVAALSTAQLTYIIPCAATTTTSWCSAFAKPEDAEALPIALLASYSGPLRLGGLSWPGSPRPPKPAYGALSAKEG
jgi:hypothetical protein